MAEHRNTDYSALAKRSVQSRRLANVERRIRELVESAPPLTDEQKRRLTVLLHPSSAA